MLIFWICLQFFLQLLYRSRRGCKSMHSFMCTYCMCESLPPLVISYCCCVPFAHSFHFLYMFALHLSLFLCSSLFMQYRVCFSFRYVKIYSHSFSKFFLSHFVIQRSTKENQWIEPVRRINEISVYIRTLPRVCKIHFF